MKTLYETADYSEALVVKGLIEQAGFLVYLSNFNAATAMPHLTPGLGLKVMVAEEDYDAALKVLQTARAANQPTKADVDSIDECPNCGSEHVVRFRSIIWLPVLWVMGLLYPVPGGNMRRCCECCTNYKAKGPAVTRPFKIAISVFLLYLMLVLFAGYIWQPDFGIPLIYWH